MIYKIKDIFDINQGHQITDEQIYNSLGEIPIFTADNVIKGYGNTSIVTADDLPCISYQTKGNIGNFYIQNELFDANNTAVLIIKEEWKDKIDLYWFISQISFIVKKYISSKQGVGYIGKEIMEDIEIDVPDIEKQKEIGEVYKDILNMDKKLKELRLHFDELLEYQIK